MTFSEFSSWKGPSREGLLTKMVLISLGLHLLVLTLFLNIIPPGGTKRKLEPAYIVDLVSSPGEEQKGKPFKATPTPSSPPSRMEIKPLPLPKPIPPKPSPVKEEPKALNQVIQPKPIPLPKPVMKKIPERKEDHNKELEQALEQLKKKVSQQKALDKTFGQLENKVKEEQALEKALARIERKHSSPTPSTKTGGTGSGTITSGVPGSQDNLGIEFQLYHASIRTRIKKNWALPEGLLKKSDISAEIMIRINRNGRIEDFRFERKSGLETFDEEVLRTIKRSDPLPPLPAGYPKASYEVNLTFHSKDLSGN